MKDRKLTQLISILDKEECEEFALFVRSPFFNKQPSLITLWDCFFYFYPKFDEKDFNEQAVWSQVFPEESFK
jgi:hypothetical protein